MVPFMYILIWKDTTEMIASRAGANKTKKVVVTDNEFAAIEC